MAVWSIPNPIIGNREPSALGNGGADSTFDDHAANRFSAASNLAGSIFDTSAPASTAALATWRPSFAAGLVGARVPGTSPLRIWSTRLTTFSATAGVSLDQG